MDAPASLRPVALLVLLRNMLISREPLYGVGEWAARHEPELLGLSAPQLPALNDDRVGRSLARLFDADIPALALNVAAHAVREFDVKLDELHNDSTTITFHGDYESAERERTLRGRLRLAVTWGHNKDHRPDLKQLLYILTVSGDGAVPMQFRVESGNATDDRSHQGTWELLCQLTGRRDFLYIADCKLATTENMAYVHQRGGRFLSVLPRTRNEDVAFRASVVRGEIRWRRIHDKYDEDGNLVDRFSICEPDTQTIEGYRLIWYHSTAQGRTRRRGSPDAARTGAAADRRATQETGFAQDSIPPACERRRGCGGSASRVQRRRLDHD